MMLKKIFKGVKKTSTDDANGVKEEVHEEGIATNVRDVLFNCETISK